MNEIPKRSQQNFAHRDIDPVIKVTSKQRQNNVVNFVQTTLWKKLQSCSEIQTFCCFHNLSKSGCSTDKKWHCKILLKFCVVCSVRYWYQFLGLWYGKDKICISPIWLLLGCAKVAIALSYLKMIELICFN